MRALFSDRIRGEGATVGFYLNEPAHVRLVEDRVDGGSRVLLEEDIPAGTHPQQLPITQRPGRGMVVLVATSFSGSTTVVSTPFEVR